MRLFKRQKSRQQKLEESESSAPSEQPKEMLDTLGDMPITQHLIELRAHLIKICIAVLIIFLALVGFSRELYDFLSNPLVAQLPANSTMIATDITSNFMAPVRLTIFVAAFVAMPYILYQIWAFVAPGLYKKEKKIAVPVLLSSILLFYAGVAFAYFIVLKGESQRSDQTP